MIKIPASALLDILSGLQKALEHIQDIENDVSYELEAENLAALLIYVASLNPESDVANWHVHELEKLASGVFE